MAIQFQDIPSDIRVPGAYIEINPTQASASTGVNQRILVIGQRRSAGSVTALTPTLVTSYNQAVANFGVGSMLAGMFKTLFDNNSTTEKWAIALDDVGGGTAAHGTITVTAASSLSGTIYLYLGGKLITVSVAAGDDDNAIATAIAAAINADTELPVTATVASEVVTVTYKHKGTVGNKYNMQANFAGALAGEIYPGGVSLAFVQLASGATDPDVATAFAVLPDEVFDYMLMPYIASAALNATDTELDNRWGPTRMLEGHMFVADKGSVSTIGTLGNGRNNEHVTLFDAANDSLEPPYIWASALVGQVAKASALDPARPFTDIELIGITAPPAASRRTQSERNTLLYDGVATHRIGTDGKVYIERLTTTYQLNSASLTDPTYLDANTVFTLARLRQTSRAMISNRFARAKIADNGTQTQTGSSTVTPNAIKAEFAALGGLWAANAWIENLPDFITNIIVERNESDPTRVDVVLKPNLVNQLQIIAAQIQFTV